MPFEELRFSPMNFEFRLARACELKVRNVIFNPPATIVLWEDGTKTVVKCQSDSQYDALTGVALCYMKKALGNTSRALNNALRGALEFKETEP